MLRVTRVYGKGGIEMELVQITADTIEDIKESLKAMKSDQTNLRIRGSAG